MQEKILEREVEKLEQMYELAIEQFEEDHPVANCWEVQSNYPPKGPRRVATWQRGNEAMTSTSCLGASSNSLCMFSKWCTIADRHTVVLANRRSW